MYKKRAQREEGFTLIEIMITMAVVVLALLGLLSANTMMQRTSGTVFERAVASQHASQVVERMRDLATGSLASVTAAFPNGGNVNAATYTSDATERLSNEAVVVSYADPAANPLDATVTVSWNAQGVRAVSTNIRTLIAKR